MMKGHSAAELLISMFVFGLFLLGLTTMLDIGLKSWNLVGIKTEVQQEGITSMNLLVRDLRMTDALSAQIGGEGEEYAVFERPIGEDGLFKYDGESGDPEWQSYVLYYTYPRNSADPKKSLDMDLDVNKFVRKKLIRKILKHEPDCNPQKLVNFQLYFIAPESGPVAGEVVIGKPNILSTHMYSLALKKNDLNSDAFDVNVTIFKSILEDRLAYTKNFDTDKGREKLLLRTTVLLKNTKS